MIRNDSNSNLSFNKSIYSSPHDSILYCSDNEYQVDHQTAACKKSLYKFFPGVLKPAVVEKLVSEMLASRGFDSSNTVFCESTCADEYYYG